MRRLQSVLLWASVVVANVLVAPELDAQFNEPATNALGRALDIPGPPAPFTKLDVQALASQAAGYLVSGCLGTCVDNLLGHIWVSARQDPTNQSANPHKIFEFSWDKTLNGGRGDWHVEMYDQPAILQQGSSTGGSVWGIRDLAAGDGVHKATIYGSCERAASGDTIFGFDVTKTTAKPERSKGFQSALDWPSTGVDSSVLTIRALAYDSNANTMYVSDWDGLVTEIKPDGTKVREFKPRDISRFGMGYDPLRRSIIAVGQTGSSIGARVGLVAVEYDTATLLETGTMFFGDRSIPGHGSVTNNGGVSGGCDLRIERRSMPTATSGVTNDIDVPVLTWCSQAVSDTVFQVYGRLQRHPFDSTGKPLTRNSGGVAGATGDAPYEGNTKFAITLSKSRASTAILFASLQSANLPFDVIGTTGSFISLDPALAFPISTVTISNGAATLPIPVPVNLGAAGLSVFIQWVESTGATGALSTAIGFVVQGG